MKTRVIGFPFGLFGNPGTAAGAELLLDAVREIRRDTAAETRPSRPACYADKLLIRELAFDTMPKVRRWRERGRKAAAATWAAGDTLLWLAGNHLGALPLYESLTPADLVVQFDAHLDVYHLTSTTEELSHGNFLRHLPRPHVPVVNLGHRDLFLPPKAIRERFAAAYSAEALALDPAPALRDVKRRAAKATRVLIDLDVDAFDPAYCPAVGHPLPFGLAPPLFLRLLDAAWGPNVIGVCVSEFDAGRDRDELGVGLLVWMVERLLLRWHERA